MQNINNHFFRISPHSTQRSTPTFLPYLPYLGSVLLKPDLDPFFSASPNHKCVCTYFRTINPFSGHLPITFSLHLFPPHQPFLLRLKYQGTTSKKSFIIFSTLLTLPKTIKAPVSRIRRPSLHNPSYDKATQRPYDFDKSTC